MSALPDSSLPRRPMVRRLTLADFRSYSALDLDVDARLVALTGENGAGKTNVLEALSMFTPGRGLRRADLGDLARIGGSGRWAVSLTLETDGDRVQLGTGIEPQEEGNLRRCRIDRAPMMW